MFDDLAPHNDVFILGAGFSRAVSSRMPLTDELGNACLALNDLAGAPGVPAAFTGGRFETWLSSIAEPQPYEPEPSNLANQVLFVKFSDAIGQVLGSLVDSVLSVSPPRWLAKFVTATHVRQATVITFNYDTLVECAVDYRDIYLPTLAEPVAWTEVTGDVPGWPAGTMRLRGCPSPALARFPPRRAVWSGVGAGVCCGRGQGRDDDGGAGGRVLAGEFVEEFALGAVQAQRDGCGWPARTRGRPPDVPGPSVGRQALA